MPIFVSDCLIMYLSVHSKPLRSVSFENTSMISMRDTDAEIAGRWLRIKAPIGVALAEEVSIKSELICTVCVALNITFMFHFNLV